jgi:hypothetical protein
MSSENVGGNCCAPRVAYQQYAPSPESSPQLIHGNSNRIDYFWGEVVERRIAHVAV